MAPRDERCATTGKLCYSQTEAKKKAKRARRRHHVVMAEWWCRACGWWHYSLGHSAKRK